MKKLTTLICTTLTFAAWSVASAGLGTLTLKIKPDPPNSQQHENTNVGSKASNDSVTKVLEKDIEREVDLLLKRVKELQSRFDGTIEEVAAREKQRIAQGDSMQATEKGFGQALDKFDNSLKAKSEKLLNTPSSQSQRPVRGPDGQITTSAAENRRLDNEYLQSIRSKSADNSAEVGVRNSEGATSNFESSLKGIQNDAPTGLSIQTRTDNSSFQSNGTVPSLEPRENWKKGQNNSSQTGKREFGQAVDNFENSLKAISEKLLNTARSQSDKPELNREGKIVRSKDQSRADDEDFLNTLESPNAKGSKGYMTQNPTADDEDYLRSIKSRSIKPSADEAEKKRAPDTFDAFLKRVKSEVNRFSRMDQELTRESEALEAERASVVVAAQLAPNSAKVSAFNARVDAHNAKLAKFHEDCDKFRAEALQELENNYEVR